MSDYLIDLANGNFTGKIVKSLGLPSPKVLRREEGGYSEKSFLKKKVFFSSASESIVSIEINKILADLGAENFSKNQFSEEKIEIAIFDATTCKTADSLKEIYDFFHPIAKRIAPHGRVILIASDYQSTTNPEEAAVSKGIEGFTRALGKEIGGKGAIANLVYVSENSNDQLKGVIRFLGSNRATYVSGQVFKLSDLVRNEENNSVELLKGKTALVTGAARGLGAATAQRLAEEGAKVICLDISFAKEALEKTATEIGGIAFTLDISTPQAPNELVKFISEKFGQIDIVIHNAGITRDKMLGNMSEEKWNQVIDVNLKAVINIDKAFDENNILKNGGKIVCLSSVSGIAGNAGQTNYSTSKAALMAYVEAQSKIFAAKNISINAVAPGFIETEMTKKIPAMIREFGRRLNSLSQGGQPRDVAELVTFLSCPDAAAITGQTIRVCGQALIGA
jgi:3-oxoacyl-[acyl-carrier protein] reductase